MGEAQFRKGEYMEAASTFAYIQRLYFSKPNLVARARLLEARCYAEMEWFYDAENLITQAQRDSFPTNMEPLKASVLGDIQLRQKQYPEAILNIENKHIKSTFLRNRCIELTKSSRCKITRICRNFLSKFFLFFIKSLKILM